MLQFLDASDIAPDLEDTNDAEEAADAEPSLGSFDRMMDHGKAWKSLDPMSAQLDGEQDDGESGIGDYDGLMEQVGTQDWRQGAQG